MTEGFHHNTTMEDALRWRKRYEQGVTLADLGKASGRTPTVIRTWIIKAGGTIRTPGGRPSKMTPRDRGLSGTLGKRRHRAR